jgi:integrase
MAHEWITAATALRYLSDQPYTYNEQRTICERAHSGLIQSRAETLLWNGEEHSLTRIPKEFWWAEGQEALTQDWVTGDFATWIDQKIEVKAFGVCFDFLAIADLLPADKRAEGMRRISVAANPDWINARDLAREVYSQISSGRASPLIIEACAVGQLSARAVRASGTVGANGTNQANWAAIEWDVPIWFWRDFTKADQSTQDWQVGTASGKAYRGGTAQTIKLQGLHFHRAGLPFLGVGKVEGMEQGMLRDLKAFFEWLAREPGYRSKLQFSDADYFNLSEKDAAIARARREKAFPTVQQVEHVLETMPAATVLERRNRALVAFASLTAARVNALASFQVGHVDLAGGYVEQDARAVRTKFAKTFRTYFMPVCGGAREIVDSWIAELQELHLWGLGDPLFPATALGISETGGFEASGLSRKGWATTGPIREIFRRAFEAAGLPYFHPHLLRDTLIHHAMALNLTPEEMKAWSQNLGHEQVLTTFTSYGNVPVHRQGELIRNLGKSESRIDALNDKALIAALAARLGKSE